MILILDDHPLARQGLYSLIQLHQTEETILQAATVREAILLMEANDVNLVFIDLNLGKENGFSFINWLREKNVSAKIFIITSSSRQSDFYRAQELGVDAYVLKDAFIDEIMYGLKAVKRGGKFYSATLMERLNKSSEEEKVLSSLTERELEVFSLLGQGYCNAQISKTLFIAEGTTKKHISSILGKLNLQNRMEAGLLASKNSYMIQMSLNHGLKTDLRREAWVR